MDVLALLVPNRHGPRAIVAVDRSIHDRAKMTFGKIPSHFAELLDSLPDVLAWVKDRQGRYLWVNRAFLIRYSLDHPGGKEFAAVESIQGKTDYDLSPAFLADQFRHDDEQVLAGHRIVNRLERVGESQGTTVWNITDKIPVVDAKGAIIGTAGITRAAGPASSLEATAPGFGPALAHMRTHFHHEITNRQLGASISSTSVPTPAISIAASSTTRQRQGRGRLIRGDRPRYSEAAASSSTI